MGKVMITFRLMPEGPETNLEEIEKNAREILGGAFKSSRSQPFAFGLNALYIIAVVPDEQGIADKLETSLGQIEGVQGVETVDLDLV